MLEPDSREPWFICESHKDVDLVWLEEIADRSMAEAIAAQ
jgi:glutamate-1-semialdehyde 2,1-aminomutase